MNVSVLALMLAGFIAFGVGAFLAANEMRLPGITLMGLGLMCQVLTLRQLRIAKAKDQSDAG